MVGDFFASTSPIQWLECSLIALGCQKSNDIQRSSIANSSNFTDALLEDKASKIDFLYLFIFFREFV